MSVTIYKIINKKIKIKMLHVKKRYKNMRKKLRNSFCSDWGDIPVATYNEDTKQFEHVENLRGIAYGSRNDVKYRNKRKYSRNRCNIDYSE